MLDKTIENEQRLERVRTDLAAVEAVLIALASSEAAEVASPEGYATWRAARDSAAAERDRLTKLKATLELAVATDAVAEADETLRKRHAAKLISNAKLGERIRDDLAKVNSILLPLLHAAATAAADDQVINAALPDDLEPLIGADQIARGKPALPRKEISSDRVELWCYRESGELAGAQDEISDRGDGVGIYETGARTYFFTKRTFVKTTYNPPEGIERAAPLWSALRLPSPDQPALLWDGQRVADLRTCLATLGRESASAARAVEIELTPCEAWQPPVAAKRRSRVKSAAEI